MQTATKIVSTVSFDYALILLRLLYSFIGVIIAYLQYTNKDISWLKKIKMQNVKNEKGYWIYGKQECECFKLYQEFKNCSFTSVWVGTFIVRCCSEKMYYQNDKQENIIRNRTGESWFNFYEYFLWHNNRFFLNKNIDIN